MDGQIVAIGMLALIAVPLYLLPSFVAAHRKSQSGAGIVILNLLLGWTLLAWVAALIWASVGAVKSSAPVASTVGAQ
jgi:RsiW-degrading membrane proteinase PrsW (M82 family)